MRRVPFYPLLITGLVSLGGYLGCDPNQVEEQLQHAVEQVGQNGLPLPNLSGGSAPAPGTTTGGLPVSTSHTNPGSPAQTTSMPQRTAGTLLIGSFNIQRLGPSKLKEPQTMEYLADIIRHFDVIALQEITSQDQNTVPALLEYVNRTGGRYSYTISPQIGRKYFEQYAFIFDTSRVYTATEACYVVQDPEDMLHREPYVGRFTVANVNNPFKFTLINIHTDPDEIRQELDVLANVYANVAKFEYPEDDVFLLGDLNADPAHFQMLGQLPDFAPIITNVPTNAAHSRTIDNLFINRYSTGEWTRRSGVLDFQADYKLAEPVAKRISDHMPIWAEFTLQEVAAGNQLATQPGFGSFR